jgi:DNA repair exonuclease SbcCD nuclease subunit
MNEFNELFIPIQSLTSEFDYIALGHYHNYTQIRDNTFYAGSLERLSFAEAGIQKGFLELKMDDKLHHQFISLKTRPMIDAPPIPCKTLTINTLMNRMKEAIQSVDPKGKIIRLILQDIPIHLYRSIDFRTIRELSAGAIHFELKPHIIREGGIYYLKSAKTMTLAGEFEEFLKSQSLQEKDVLLDLGMEYIHRVESKDEGS